MPRSLLWLLLLLCWCSSVSTAVRLGVQHGEYVELCCGEPCKWLTFRLNRTSSETWLHNGAYIAASRTYYQSLSGQYDSEVFYFNDVDDVYRIRLRMRYFPVPGVVVGRETLSIDGTLGLGPRSQLWTIWNNYTLTKRLLDLGHYNPYGQRHYAVRPPILDLHTTQHLKLGDNSVVEVNFDISTTETFIPYGTNLSAAFKSITIDSRDCRERYRQIGVLDDVECQDSITVTPDQFQTVTLGNGIEYEAIDYADGNQMIIGTRFIDDFFWFRSLDGHSVIIAEDAFFLDYVGVSVGCSIGLTALFVVWLSIADSKNDRTNFYEFMLMSCAEALSYLLDFLLMLVAFGMLDWTRYITQYAQTSAVYAVFFLLFSFLSSIAAFLWSLWTWRGYAHYLDVFRQRGLFRITLFATSQALVIWLCLIEQHETTFDRGFEILLITGISIMQLTAAALYYFRGHYHYSAGLALLYLGTTVFLIVYNLVPAFRYGNMRHSFAVASLLWIYFLELVPATNIAMIIMLHRALRHVEKRMQPAS